MWRALVAVAMLLAQGACSGERAEPLEPESIRLEIELHQEGTADSPRWEAYLANRGEQAATVVLPGDGSCWGWRTPRIEWIVETNGQARTQRRSGGRCGNINALTRDEVVLLPPGDSVALHRYGFGRPALPDAGEALVRVRYTHDPELEWEGIALGEHDARAMKRIRSSTACSATSNVVRLQRE